jgi:hypothetical protein
VLRPSLGPLVPLMKAAFDGWFYASGSDKACRDKVGLVLGEGSLSTLSGTGSLGPRRFVGGGVLGPHRHRRHDQPPRISAHSVRQAQSALPTLS